MQPTIAVLSGSWATWAAGIAFSVVLGHLATWLFLTALRRISRLGAKPATDGVPKRIAPWLTGIVERVAFTVFVGTGASGVLPAMFAWLAVKLATNWNHPHWKDNPDVRTWAMSAVLAGLVSLFFAYVGGLVASGALNVGI